MTLEDYKSHNSQVYEIEKKQLPYDTQVDDIDNYMAWRKFNLTEQDSKAIETRTLKSLKLDAEKKSLYQFLLFACHVGFTRYGKGEK